MKVTKICTGLTYLLYILDFLSGRHGYRMAVKRVGLQWKLFIKTNTKINLVSALKAEG